MKRARRVYITGMGRTASTVLYNAVRLAMLEQGTTCATVDMKYNREDPAEYHVVKGHQYKGWHWSWWADKLLTARRDLRDIVASYKRKNAAMRKNHPEVKLWDPDHMALGNASVEWHQSWLSVSHREWVYEEYLLSPREYIASFLETLGYELSEATYQYVYDLPKFEAGEPDPGSLMTPCHITDGRVGSYAETLTADEINAIETRHGWWLEKYGYKCS